MALHRILINNTWYILPIPDKADTLDAQGKVNDHKYMTPKTTMDLIDSLENIGGIKEVDISGTGNAITSLSSSEDGMTLIATKGSTFLTGITKTQVENVLTGNITTHTHSQYITNTTMADTTTLGLVKLGAPKLTTLTTTPSADNTANRYYPVQTDNNNKLVVNVPWENDNTWNANSLNVAGYVTAPTSTNKNKVWKTDGSGNPGWRDDSNTVTTIGTLTTTGVSGAVTLVGTGGTTVEHEDYTFTINSTDTKNTAGSTNTSSKIFLIGALSQSANPQTYSHDTAYVGTDGALYSEDKKVATEQYVHSRGQNLLTNGSALLGNNTNFSNFTYDGSEAYYSGGSFRYKRPENGGQVTSTDEFMPVNPELRYKFEMFAKSLLGTGYYYYYIDFYDVDGNQISASHHMYRENTLTTLAQALKPGDTVMYLANASNWDNSGVGTHLRSLIIWDYKNSFGYQYAPETYSRYWTNNAWNIGGINYTNNTITLRVPWSGRTVPAGTYVSNGSSGGTYKYLWNGYLTTNWEYYSGIVEGVDLSGKNAGNKFPPGTAKAKVGWLMDYNVVGDTAWFANLSFGLDYLKPHASAINTYGLGTTALFGHVKTVNNLLSSTYSDGYALSAYQGYLLDQNKQPLSSALTSIAGLTTAVDQMIYTTAANTYKTTALTSTARSLLDDTSITAMRTTLGLGSLATLSTVNDDNFNTTSGKQLTATKGGTGQSTYAKGDLLYASEANTLSKLGVGNEGEILKVVSGLPSWETEYSYTHPNHTGDVTSTGDGATVIANKAVTLSKMSDLAANSIIGNNTASSGTPKALTKSEVLDFLSPIPVNKGGTGLTTLPSGEILLGNATGTLNSRSIVDSTTANAIGTSTSIPTERDIYNGLPTINGAHNYTSSTNIYAPTENGTNGYILKANGGTSAPTWISRIATSNLPTGPTGTVLAGNGTSNPSYKQLSTINSVSLLDGVNIDISEGAHVEMLIAELEPNDVVSLSSLSVFRELRLEMMLSYASSGQTYLGDTQIIKPTEIVDTSAGDTQTWVNASQSEWNSGTQIYNGTHDNFTQFVNFLNTSYPASYQVSTAVARGYLNDFETYAYRKIASTTITAYKGITLLGSRNDETFVGRFAAINSTQARFNVTNPSGGNYTLKIYGINGGGEGGGGAVKTLNTTHTTTQTPLASEPILGTSSINLHKVSKTGNYNDLINKLNTGYTTNPNDKNYKVQTDASNNMFVNVPWDNTNTITRLRGTTSGSYESGDITLAAGTNVTISQSGKTITINSTASTDFGENEIYIGNGTTQPRFGIRSDGTSQNLVIRGMGSATAIVNIPHNKTGIIATMDDIPSAFIRSVSGLVPAPGGTGTTRYLREDGSWAAPVSAPLILTQGAGSATIQAANTFSTTAGLAAFQGTSTAGNVYLSTFRNNIRAAVYAEQPTYASGTKYAGYFNGDVRITGNLTVDGTYPGGGGGGSAWTYLGTAPHSAGVMMFYPENVNEIYVVYSNVSGGKFSTMSEVLYGPVTAVSNATLPGYPSSYITCTSDYIEIMWDTIQGAGWKNYVSVYMR